LQEILQFDEDESLVFLLLDDPNSDPWGCAGLFCNEEKLNDKLNLHSSIKVGVNILNISVLNGENICVQFTIVQSKLKLKVKKGKMVQP
jgi:hypothetical protein